MIDDKAKIKAVDDKGWLILKRNLKKGRTDFLINKNLLIRIRKIKENEVILAFKDLDPKKYNMIERAEAVKDLRY